MRVLQASAAHGVLLILHTRCVVSHSPELCRSNLGLCPLHPLYVPFVRPAPLSPPNTPPADHFAILFFVTVLMLAFMGWNLLGKNADSFRDFAWTFNTVMLMATGDSPDFSEVFWRREPFFGIVRVSARLSQ